ncbi:MAG: hypothetical protein MJ097_02365 [Dorea sp.]|nr:hypothetical protein [Dorea sp.]
MEEQNFDLEFEKIIEEEFGSLQKKEIVRGLSYEEEFEAKKKLIQMGMKTLFICILMVAIIVLRFAGGFPELDLIVDVAILVAVLLTVIYAFAFFKKLKKK